MNSRVWNLLIFLTLVSMESTHLVIFSTSAKGPVKLIKQLKIAHSFLQFVSNQFHVIILSLLM